jgi:hypothetical protein
VVERNCTSKGETVKMKEFIMGVICGGIVFVWIFLALIGIISIKIAILIPVCIVIGFLVATWLFGKLMEM